MCFDGSCLGQFLVGPATVRMVSNNGPPLPMPMQVPPGHMVQQIIDENGILTNVILSSQPPGIAAPPMMVGYYVRTTLLISSSGQKKYRCVSGNSGIFMQCCI